MKRNPLIISLQLLICISPLPFGFVSRTWNPLLYLLVGVVSLIAYQQRNTRISLPYRKPIRWFIAALFALTLLQLVPLPWFLLKGISPHSAYVVSALSSGGTLPRFHPISLVPMETFLQFCRWTIWLLFFHSLLRVQINKKELFTLFNTILISGAFQLMLAFLKLADGNRKFFLFFHPNTEKDVFLAGTIANADHFSFYLELIFPVAVGLFLARLLYYQPGESLGKKLAKTLEENKTVLAYLLMAVMSGAGIILTGSRSGIMSFFLGAFIFLQMSFYLRLSFPAQRKIKMVLIALTLVAVFIGVQDTVGKFLSESTLENGRLIYWGNAMKMLGDFPIIGAGFGTFKFSYSLYDNQHTGWLTHAHNEYMETLAEGGLLGTAVILGLGLLILMSMLKVWTDRHHPEIKALGLAVMISIATASLHLFFEFALRVPANFFLFLLLIILGLKTVTYRKDTGYEIPPH